MIVMDAKLEINEIYYNYNKCKINNECDTNIDWKGGFLMGLKLDLVFCQPVGYSSSVIECSWCI